MFFFFFHLHIIKMQKIDLFDSTYGQEFYKYIIIYQKRIMYFLRTCIKQNS